MSDRSRGAKVVVHLMGGLGNQLFQYAFSRHLAYANEATLEFDTSGYFGSRISDGPPWARYCELQHFRIVGDFTAPAAASGGRAILARVFRKALRLLVTISDQIKPYYARSVIVEPESQRFRFDPRILERKIVGTVGVRGFWQSEMYFRDIDLILRQELRPLEERDTGNAVLADRIRTGESVAVHVRHGDNATSVAPSLGVLPADYYRACVEAIRRDAQAPEFFVFSDDIAWARELLDGMAPLTFVERREPSAAYQDLRLMALCKHHIIANSTFSWWGAWLGRKPHQVVYAPRRYYQNLDRENPDYYPEGWRLI